jgi:plastocyanin
VRKLLLALPALAIALMAVFASTGQSASAVTTISVKVGGGAEGYAVNLFAPGTVYVQPGDTVKFTFPWLEPHSVTFGAPAGDPSVLVGGANPSYEGASFISSGLVFGGPTSTETYSVTFPKKGNFDYFCILHPLMKGNVVVQTPDLGTPDNQASVDARGDAVVSSGLSQLKAVAAAMAAKPVAIGANASGGRKYTLSISSSTDQPSGDVQQFFPASISIGVNDSVEWVSGVQTPHTISIGNPGEIAALIPPGGAEAVLDIARKVPAGGKYDGTGIVNSGVLGVGYPNGTKFELGFSKAGTYQYFCFLHFDQGMMARVVVGAPGAPNTGDSQILAASPDGTTGLWLVAGSVLFAILATGAAFGVARRS